MTLGESLHPVDCIRGESSRGFAKSLAKSCARFANKRGDDLANSWQIAVVQTRVLQELQRRRAEVRRSWEILLRVEPVSSPLANPDALMHMFDQSFDEIVAAAAEPIRLEANEAFSCPCGRNPLVAYFAAGRQAIHEALVLTPCPVAIIPSLSKRT